MQSIEFQIRHQVEFGKAIYFANSEFNWQIDKISRMQCIEQNIWSIQILLSNEILEYKYAIGNYDIANFNDLIWEKGNNRVLKKNSKIQDRVIRDEWEKKKAVIKLAVGKQFGTCYLIGKFNNNILIQNMKLIIKKQSNYFKTRIYVDKNDQNLSIQIQYYLLLYNNNCKNYQIFKDTFELISQPMYFQNIFQMKELIQPISISSYQQIC